MCAGNIRRTGPTPATATRAALSSPAPRAAGSRSVSSSLGRGRLGATKTGVYVRAEQLLRRRSSSQIALQGPISNWTGPATATATCSCWFASVRRADDLLRGPASSPESYGGVQLTTTCWVPGDWSGFHQAVPGQQLVRRRHRVDLRPRDAPGPVCSTTASDGAGAFKGLAGVQIGSWLELRRSTSGDEQLDRQRACRT